ncbi:MAG: hypothetical protein ACI4SE_02725 [Lachnospiraceae bacterium]
MNKSNFFSQTAPSINFIAVILCAVGVVSTLLAKVVEKASYMGESIKEATSIMTVYGAFMLVLFVLTAVILFLKKNNSALILAVINALFCIFKLIQQLAHLGLGAEEKAAIEMIEAFGGSYSMSVNFFFWLMVIAAIAIVVVLLLPLFGAKKDQAPQM